MCPLLGKSTMASVLKLRGRNLLMRALVLGRSSDLDLGGLRSDLRGRPRPEIENLRFYTEATEAEVLLKV